MGGGVGGLLGELGGIGRGVGECRGERWACMLCTGGQRNTNSNAGQQLPSLSTQQRSATACCLEGLAKVLHEVTTQIRGEVDKISCLRCCLVLCLELPTRDQDRSWTACFSTSSQSFDQRQ